MLGRATEIDAKAAYESTSWGIGQVMGAHWLWLGYPNVQALVAEARSGAAGQIRLMVRYIDKAGLARSLNAHDWPAFARGYNGPDYARNGYDKKLAAAYQRHATAAKASSVVLCFGSTPEAMRLPNCNAALPGSAIPCRWTACSAGQHRRLCATSRGIVASSRMV